MCLRKGGHWLRASQGAADTPATGSYPPTGSPPNTQSHNLMIQATHSTCLPTHLSLAYKDPAPSPRPLPKPHSPLTQQRTLPCCQRRLGLGQVVQAVMQGGELSRAVVAALSAERTKLRGGAGKRVLRHVPRRVGLQQVGVCGWSGLVVSTMCCWYAWVRPLACDGVCRKRSWYGDAPLVLHVRLLVSHQEVGMHAPRHRTPGPVVPGPARRRPATPPCYWPPMRPPVRCT